MKIIDIRARQIPDEELLKESHARFHLDVKEVSPQESKKLPLYEVEVGRKESASWRSGWLRGLKQVSFAFSTRFGLKKRYRIKASFLLSCLLLLFLFSGLKGFSAALDLKEQLTQRDFFAASLTVKGVNKHLASLGEIPELLTDKVKALNLGSAFAEFFLRVSGYYNPRYYLILFQNNSEIRATGGFIGSYALLKVDVGKVEIKKIEGIFNVSGQQRVKVVPPEPLQKISTSWQLHDANWFFDFPTSAKTIAWLYEKSGGPTVDGIIALTPEFASRFFRLTGPIELEAFGVKLDGENFMDIVQYEVEVNYKKRGLKDPKEILAHLAPNLLERASKLPKETLAQILLDALTKKEALLYFSRPEEEAFINYHHWGGEVLPSEGDYLAVVNSNINGFKTDKMMRQQVSHQSEIDEDGHIVNTVKVTREHQGGESEYDWYNRVNADFLRLYVPKGSTLLEVEGGTAEATSQPFDYQKAGYIDYPEIKKVNTSTIIDPETGIYIAEEQGKTVFGVWVYTSPGETTKLTFRYLLPFTLDRKRDFNSLYLTVQKQAGITYELVHRVIGGRVIWQSCTSNIIDQDRIYASIVSLK